MTLTDDGKGVILAGYEEKVTVVLNHPTDIYRVMAQCQWALDNINKTRKTKKFRTNR
jgi:hypothetical protein